MAKDIIKIHQINKKFLQQEVLKDINLSIKQGSITGIIGKSGAGKTTLLRCMNLLEQPDSGIIEINSKNILKLKANKLKLLRQKIGMVFQSFNLISNYTVAQNIALPIEIAGKSKQYISQKVAAIAKLVGLKDKLAEYPSCLSGGQKQRVAIARALVGEVEILLCDEFTSALDPETTLEILELLRDINKSLNVTIILITHDMSVIREICDFVFVINNGEIVETGEIEQIFYNPHHEITKSLISTMFARDIPNAFKTRIIDKPVKNCEIMLRLLFGKSSSQQAIISEMIKVFDISINIISGHLDHIRDATLGNLMITFKYDSKLLAKIITYFEEHQISFELLGYLRGVDE